MRLLVRTAPYLLYALGSMLVLLGGYVVSKYVGGNRCSGHHFGYTSWLSNWDGQWYQYIVDRGYHYARDDGYGPQVFFPLYPLLGKALAAVSPFHGQMPLVVVSWLATLAFCPAWMRYGQERLPIPGEGAALWGLAVVLLWPASYFLRVAYTEALYLLLLTVFFYGCARKWPPLYLVGIVGLLTATRPTAVLLCAVLSLHVFMRYSTLPIGRRIFLTAALGLLSAWGLYAYMAYLYLEFGNPLLFVSKQLGWNYKMPADIFLRRWQEMLSFRPAWGFLVDGSLTDVSTYPWNLQNKALWLVSLVLIGVGSLKKWLTVEEALFCLMTVLLVYYTHGPKNMESVGRYMFTLVPLYLVMTRLLLKMPIPLRLGVLMVSAALLVVQSAHFRLWHCVF